jgi:hypothetical protein
MKAGELVLVYLASPREKFWGLLRETTPAGVTVRGLPLDLLEGWIRELARGGPFSAFPTTVFFPLHRVERMFVDETAGDAASYAERFQVVVGRDVRDFLE